MKGINVMVLLDIIIKLLQLLKDTDKDGRPDVVDSYPEDSTKK